MGYIHLNRCIHVEPIQLVSRSEFQAVKAQIEICILHWGLSLTLYFMFHEGLKQLAVSFPPAQPSLSLEASKGQSLRQSHHPTLPEICQILAMKRSCTLGFLASCFPFATSSTGCTSSEPLAPKVPNLFLAILSIFFTTTNLKGEKWGFRCPPVSPSSWTCQQEVESTYLHWRNRCLLLVYSKFFRHGRAHWFQLLHQPCRAKPDLLTHLAHP